MGEKKRYRCNGCGVRGLGDINRKYCSRDCYFEKKRLVRKIEQYNMIWDLLPIFMVLGFVGIVGYFMIR